jgi:hypothetical protein
MEFDFFKSKNASAFGTELADYFIDKTKSMQLVKEKKFAEKTNKILNGIILKINCYKSSNKLNFYTKAKLANNFKWKLQDAGYHKDYVNDITEWLVKHL